MFLFFFQIAHFYCSVVSIILYSYKYHLKKEQGTSVRGGCSFPLSAHGEQGRRKRPLPVQADRSDKPQISGGTSVIARLTSQPLTKCRHP